MIDPYAQFVANLQESVPRLKAGDFRRGQDEPIVEVSEHPDPVLVEDGGDGSHNSCKDLRGSREAETQHLELVRHPLDDKAEVAA